MQNNDMKRLVCFHLFNDYSGSPRVLRQVLGELLLEGRQVDLVTSRGGILDTLAGHGGIRIFHNRYRFSRNPMVALFRYAWIQFYTFFFSFRYLFRRDIVFYINTILPVAPALAARIMGKKVVYHYHENAFVKGRTYKSLCWLMQRLASEIICVSEYQRGFLKREKGVSVVPNALPRDFCDAFEGIERRMPTSPKTVLMLASLKGYKGIREFIELARRLPQFAFRLILSDTRENIDSYLSGEDRPENLDIFEIQENVIDFYRQASLVLNLSDKTQVIETFGLTTLEAMTAGLPVIVPTVGGIAELVEDGVNGYKIDVGNLKEIERHIDKILSDDDLYGQLSRNAKRKSERYSIRESGKTINILIG